jgi:MinD-like ATPase involved in chromosome partitioning or flagellar assembly
MAVANIAVILTRMQRKTLVVDFDFKAPALWNYFRHFQPELDDREGMFDILVAQRDTGRGRPINWRDYVISLEFDGHAISFITCGRLDGDYSDRVLGFHLEEFYRTDGSEFTELLRREWTDNYDVILIDAHAGMAEITDVCLAVLPDVIVPVVLANSLSVEGILTTLSSVQRTRASLQYDRPPVLCLPVLSRIDEHADRAEVEEWINEVRRKFASYFAACLPLV